MIIPMKGKSITVSLLLTVTTISTVMTFIPSCKKEAKVTLPVITTSTPTDITPIAAICGGTVASEGGEATWIRGIALDTLSHPTSFGYSTGNSNGVWGLGDFSFPITGLKPLTKYYFRAYAQNSAGTGYGNEISFSTPALVIGAKVADGIAFDIDISGLHGLACAPKDEGTLPWSNGSYVNTAAIDVENGYENTNLIYTTEGGTTNTYAAIACTNHGPGVYPDQSYPHGFIWYLPSKNELSKLYLQKNVIGGFSDGAYWSSTEFDLKNAWTKDFSNGKETTTDKAITHHVRAIRPF
jgi:hypothetical protein